MNLTTTGVEPQLPITGWILSDIVYWLKNDGHSKKQLTRHVTEVFVFLILRWGSSVLIIWKTYNWVSSIVSLH